MFFHPKSAGVGFEAWPGPAGAPVPRLPVLAPAALAAVQPVATPRTPAITINR